MVQLMEQRLSHIAINYPATKSRRIQTQFGLNQILNIKSDKEIIFRYVFKKKFEIESIQGNEGTTINNIFIHTIRLMELITV